MGGGWTKTKLMLNSTQVEVEVEVGVELGNMGLYSILYFTSRYCAILCIIYMTRLVSNYNIH